MRACDLCSKLGKMTNAIKVEAFDGKGELDLCPFHVERYKDSMTLAQSLFLTRQDQFSVVDAHQFLSRIAPLSQGIKT